MGGACRVRQGRHQGPVTIGACARHWQSKEENTQQFPERGGGAHLQVYQIALVRTAKVSIV